MVPFQTILEHQGRGDICAELFYFTPADPFFGDGILIARELGGIILVQWRLGRVEQPVPDGDIGRNCIL